MAFTPCSILSPTPFYWLPLSTCGITITFLCWITVGLWYSSITHSNPGYVTVPRGAECVIHLTRGWRQSIHPDERQLTVSSQLLPGKRVPRFVSWLLMPVRFHVYFCRGGMLSLWLGQKPRLPIDFWQISEITYLATSCMVHLVLVQHLM